MVPLGKQKPFLLAWCSCSRPWCCKAQARKRNEPTSNDNEAFSRPIACLRLLLLGQDVVGLLLLKMLIVVLLLVSTVTTLGCSQR